MQTRNTNYIYKNDLDKACFQHNIVYGKYKDPAKKAQSDKFSRDKAFKIASILKYDGYQRGSGSMIYHFFDKKAIGRGIEFMLIQQLADEVHKPIIRKFKERRVYSSCEDNIWGVDLADMQLIRKYNKGIRFLLCTIELLLPYKSYLYFIFIKIVTFYYQLKYYHLENMLGLFL